MLPTGPSVPALPSRCPVAASSGHVGSSAPGVVALTGGMIGRLGSRRPIVAGVLYRPM